ncbi:hypothetical protein [Haloferax sp. DFSO52]|uniref:hypothetical protein n=1 Tax=Haloferax sp. DFSO52 TaxID=3388505 RepID=UPI003A85F370
MISGTAAGERRKSAFGSSQRRDSNRFEPTPTDRPLAPVPLVFSPPPSKRA